MRFLFDELDAPDPRGLELRHVRLRNGSRDSPSVDSIGFVLPDAPIQGRRFVIAADGLVHAAEAIGERVDDGRLALDGFLREEHVDSQRLCFPSLRIKEALWRVWLQRAGLSVPARVECEMSWDNVLQDVAEAWVLNHLLRAVSSHERGDDVLALHDLRFVEQRLERGEPHGSWLSRWIRDVHEPLLADQERRARSTPVRLEPPDCSPEGQVRQLILDLDGPFPGTPFDRFYLVDTAAALREMGGVAVPALLDAFGEDERLTRSVLHLDYASWLGLVSVHRALRSILRHLFDISDLARASGQSVQTEEQRLRQYWSRYGHLGGAETWYAILRDPDGSEFWYHAGVNLTQHLPTGLGRWSRAEDPAKPALLAGLRDGRSPSVASLLSTRISGVLSQIQPESEPEDANQRSLQYTACALSAALADWDIRAGQRTLRRHLRSCEQTECPCLYGLYEALMTEPGVARRYLRRLNRVGPGEIAHQLSSAIGHEDIPALRHGLARLFAQAAWHTEILRKAEALALGLQVYRDVFESALADESVAGFMDCDSEQWYSVSVFYACSEIDMCWLSTPESCAGDCHSHDGAPCQADDVCHGVVDFGQQLEEGASCQPSIRVADLTVFAFQRMQTSLEFPPFRFEWPEARRDQAIAAMRQRVQAGGPFETRVIQQEEIAIHPIREQRCLTEQPATQ